MALWAAGKAPEKLSAWSQECLEGKIKKKFRSPKSCFFNLQLEGSPFAMALWAAGKAPEKLSAWSQECLEGFAIGRVSLCNGTMGSWKSTWKAQCLAPRVSGREKIKKQLFGARKVVLPLQWHYTGSWKSTWKAQCLVPRVSGRENKKKLFGARKVVFLICNWKGLPLQWHYGQLEKHLQYVLGFVLQANLSFFSIDR